MNIYKTIKYGYISSVPENIRLDRSGFNTRTSLIKWDMIKPDDYYDTIYFIVYLDGVFYEETTDNFIVIITPNLYASYEIAIYQAPRSGYRYGAGQELDVDSKAQIIFTAKKVGDIQRYLIYTDNTGGVVNYSKNLASIDAVTGLATTSGYAITDNIYTLRTAKIFNVFNSGTVVDCVYFNSGFKIQRVGPHIYMFVNWKKVLRLTEGVLYITGSFFDGLAVESGSADAIDYNAVTNKMFFSINSNCIMEVDDDGNVYTAPNISRQEGITIGAGSGCVQLDGSVINFVNDGAIEMQIAEATDILIGGTVYEGNAAL